MPLKYQLGLALFAVVMFASSALAAEFFQPVQPPRGFQVMVHRGMSRQAPENTRPALERTIDDGFEWAEVDVRLTKDGQHVLLHNARVDGKTDGQGDVKELTLEQVLKLDAGKWFAPRYTGQLVLTLPECLALAKQRFNLYLDCKDVDAGRLVDEILAAAMADQVVVFADLDTLAQIRQKSDGRIAIMPKWRPEFGLDNWIARWKPDAVEIDAEQLTPEVCQKFHAAKIKVQAKTLGVGDRPEVWDRVLEAGVDFIQTDRPEDLLADRFWKRLSARPVQISLHRGANRYAPENTLPAFEKAIALGVDYVEFDIRASKDGQFFILHDGSLKRTTDATSPISAMDAADIRKLDAGSWFGLPFQSTRVPDLDAALRVLGGRVQLYVDAKQIAPEDLARELRNRGLFEQAVVYQSPGYLGQLKSIAPEVRTLCPLGRADRLDALAESVKPYGFDVAWEILSKDLIDRCHAHQIKVFSDALGSHDRVEEHLRAIQWGIDVIQTDHPLRVIRAVELHTAGGKR